MEEQEQAFMRYIDYLDKANTSTRHPMIVGAANHLLRLQNRTFGRQTLALPVSGPQILNSMYENKSFCYRSQK